MRDFPQDRLPQVALVGRSNVGKSSLINALLRKRIARTSAAPGKTRLANIYRVARESAPPLYLVDLPGYGYTRGAREAARGFDEVTGAFFGQARLPATPAIAALLLVDLRHPGLQKDIDAWRWLEETVEHRSVVATKIDKLSRAERQRAIRTNEAVYEHPVLPVSAVTGEGLDELWKLIDNLANSSSPKPRRNNNRNPRPGVTAQPLPKK